jgi:beta-aspartyl-peptidase (threonine type)
MSKISIVVHGGAGPDSDYIKKNLEAYKKGLKAAVDAGYRVLAEGGSSVDAVEAAVRTMEDNPLFNAGKGAALNAKAEAELCSSIMSGKDLKSGAVAIVKNVRNPVSLARVVMDETKHIYIGSHGALSLAQEYDVPLEPDAYFVTEYRYEEYEKARKEAQGDQQAVAKEQVAERMHGTIGAVAVDRRGNVSAATSTGGTEYQKEGRIGDSSMIGVGTYANNKTCAVSTTGDGELHIQHVSAFHISALMEYAKMGLQEACHHFIHEKCGEVDGDMGLIAVDPGGNIAMEFNAERMHRAWKTSDGDEGVEIY